MPSAPLDAHIANPKRAHIDRIGVRVLEEMVEMIVTGAVAADEFLPPEQALCDEFGVSRTVIRECIKRMQEKGLVVVAPGTRNASAALQRLERARPRGFRRTRSS